MRVLVCIPHFFNRKNKAFETTMGSHNETIEQRAGTLAKCISKLSLMLSERAVYIGTSGQTKIGEGVVCFDEARPFKKDISGDIIICTDQENHLVEQITTNTITKHYLSGRSPEELGYACRDIFASLNEHYDLFCFVEDDMIFDDPLFFHKIYSFYDTYGDNYVLSPNRFEIWGRMDVQWKIYLEGEPPPNHRIRNYTHAPGKLTFGCRYGIVDLWLSPSMYSGCFVITKNQLQSWMRQSDFFRPSSQLRERMDVMEIAQLPMGGNLPIYKPAPEYASFLELHHTPNRIVNSKTPWKAVMTQIGDDINRKRNTKLVIKP